MVLCLSYQLYSILSFLTTAFTSSSHVTSFSDKHIPLFMKYIVFICLAIMPQSPLKTLCGVCPKESEEWSCHLLR